MMRIADDVYNADPYDVSGWKLEKSIQAVTTGLGNLRAELDTESGASAQWQQSDNQLGSDDESVDIKFQGEERRYEAESDKDHVAVYKRGGDCAVAFSGTDSWRELISGLEILPKDECGMSGVHAGFLRELKQVWETPAFRKEILAYLKSDACKRVFAVGHSLGGALATLFATIVNSEGCFLYPDSEDLVVSRLYTVGAPAVSQTQLVNKASTNGCFGGKRFFNMDESAVDGVTRAYQVSLPESVSKLINKADGPDVGAFKHPKMTAVQLKETGGHNKKYEALTYDCEDGETATVPSGTDGNTNVVEKLWSLTLHERTKYIERAQKIWPACDEDSWPDKDHGLICGACKVLVTRFSSVYKTCSGYCAKVGRKCAGAWEERSDTCEVKFDMTCDQSIHSSDAICECGDLLPDQAGFRR